MQEADAEKVADFIHQALQASGNTTKLHAIRERVYDFSEAFPMPR
jgi:glycine/serine hydroxymethyltransferase